MKTFGRLLTIAAIAVAGFLFTEGAFSGGDTPFPLVGEEDNVILREVWENVDGSRKVKLYHADSGEDYVVIESAHPKKVEVLRRTR